MSPTATSPLGLSAFSGTSIPRRESNPRPSRRFSMIRSFHVQKQPKATKLSNLAPMFRAEHSEVACLSFLTEFAKSSGKVTQINRNVPRGTLQVTCCAFESVFFRDGPQINQCYARNILNHSSGRPITVLSCFFPAGLAVVVSY